MLCADPTTKEIRRFLVGPKRCEITGVLRHPGRAHDVRRHPAPRRGPDGAPGDPANPKAFSSWPDGAAGGRPRSSLIVITKDDGGDHRHLTATGGTVTLRS